MNNQVKIIIEKAILTGSYQFAPVYEASHRDWQRARRDMVPGPWKKCI